MQEKQAITGIVVCGGQSSRMGTDKCMLDYHGRPQWQYLYEMLQGLCADVRLSVNREQARRLPAGLSLLADLPVYEQAGPMAALLTAATLLPGHNLLLIDCDYPLLQAAELERFLHFINKGQPAAFYNEVAQVYEPLLAYYPAAVIPAARTRFEQGNASLQALLSAQQADRYIPANLQCLTSADTPEQYQVIKTLIHGPGFKKEG